MHFINPINWLKCQTKFWTILSLGNNNQATNSASETIEGRLTLSNFCTFPFVNVKCIALKEHKIFALAEVCATQTHLWRILGRSTPDLVKSFWSLLALEDLSQQMYLRTNWCVRLVHICHAGERKQIGRRLPLITLVGMRSCGLGEGENNKPLSANKGHTQLSHATEQSAPSCSLPFVPATNRHIPLIKVSKFAS